MTNRQVEQAALDFVTAYERQQGREPRDCRYRGEAADLKSSGRVIEIKAYGKSCRDQGFLWLEVRQVEEARANPDFYLYVVEQVRSGNPTLKVLHGAPLARMLEGAREKRYFEVPWSTREYDATPVERLEPAEPPLPPVP